MTHPTGCLCDSCTEERIRRLGIGPPPAFVPRPPEADPIPPPPLRKVVCEACPGGDHAVAGSQVPLDYQGPLPFEVERVLCANAWRRRMRLVENERARKATPKVAREQRRRLEREARARAQAAAQRERDEALRLAILKHERAQRRARGW